MDKITNNCYIITLYHVEIFIYYFVSLNGIINFKILTIHNKSITNITDN